MAMIGLPNCSCFIPAATQSALAPAILLPSVQTLLLNGCFISLLSLYIILFFITRRSLSSLLLTILTAKIVRIYETNNKNPQKLSFFCGFLLENKLNCLQFIRALTQKQSDCAIIQGSLYVLYKQIRVQIPRQNEPSPQPACYQHQLLVLPPEVSTYEARHSPP